jgi:hypothetical protein
LVGFELHRSGALRVTTRPGLWEQVIELALEAWIDDEAARLVDARMHRTANGGQGDVTTRLDYSTERG